MLNSTFYVPDANAKHILHFKSQINQLAQLGEVLDGANHLRGVGVLVVVPGHDLLTGPKVACQLTLRAFSLFFW